MKKKIYFILQHLCTGGIEICVVNTANALAERGYAVTLLCVLKDNELQNKIHPKIELVYLTSLHRGKASLGYKLFRRIYSYWVLRRMIRKTKNVVIVSTRVEYNILLSKYAQDSNLRIAQLHHDYIFEKKLAVDFKNKYGNIDYFFLLTNDVRYEIEQIMKGYNNHTKCITIPNFYPNQDLSFSNNPIRNNVALAVGRLSPEKGFLRLLDVWNLVIKKTKRNYILFLVGDGDERSAIENHINKLGLEKSVKLLGLLSNQEVRKLMQMAKVFCMSSFTEAFPLVLLESLNNGLPQIAFDVRVGPRNIIADGETGYLVPDGNIELYSSKIIQLFEDANEWERMSVASKKRANLYSENSIIKKWEEVINECRLD